MHPSTTLRIDAPCAERWGDMTPLTEGRHCTSCQQLVRDFTTFSDAELVAWFASQNGPVCGRLRDDQLNVPLRADVPVTVGQRVRGWVRWAFALVLGWQTAYAQSEKGHRPSATKASVLATSKAIKAQPTPPTDKPLEKPVCQIIRGQVLYSNGKPAPNVEVWRKDGIRFEEGLYIRTDSEGRFSIPIHSSDQQTDSLILLIDASFNEVAISTRQEQKPLVIKLHYNNEPILLGRVVPVSKTKG